MSKVKEEPNKNTVKLLGNIYATLKLFDVF